MDKLEGIKKGDTVEVTVRGVVKDCSRVLGIIPDGGTHWTGFDPADIASPFFSIKKVEPPIAVGDRVSWRHDYSCYEVVAINGDMAWCCDGVLNRVLPIASLRPA
jgi:hypothetical protein